MIIYTGPELDTFSLSLSLSLILPSSLISLSHQLEVPHALYLATEYNITRGSCGKYVQCSMTHISILHICFHKVHTERSDIDCKSVLLLTSCNSSCIRIDYKALSTTCTSMYSMLKLVGAHAPIKDT